MASGYNTTTQSVSAVAATAPVPITPVWNSVGMLPSILVGLTSGASLTYTVQVTGDDVFANGYNPATGNWFPFTNMANLTTGAVATLGAAVTAVRLNVTVWASGTATMSIVQPSST